MYSYLFDAVNLSRLCAEGFGELSVLLLDTAGHIGLFIQQFLLQRPVGEGENLRGEEGGGGQAAMKAAGIEHPTHSPIRGGTDGSVLTYKGLLCPNLPSAGHNAHGRYEYAPVESLKTGVKTVKALVSPELVETIIGKKEG